MCAKTVISCCGLNPQARPSANASAATLPAAYDASWAGTVADIGGGDGTVLAALLAATPGARGILFDTAPGSAEAPEVLARADQTWSLGPLTLPHMLVRLVVAEQLYRAAAMLANHPYHRA